MTIYRSINALAETLNGTYKAELIRARVPWRTRNEAEFVTIGGIHWFNHDRLHSYCSDETAAR